MPFLMLIALNFVSLDDSQPPSGPREATQLARRVIEGFVRDARGHAVTEGKVLLAPRDPTAPFQDSAAASIDDKGRYRIELSAFQFGAIAKPATGALRYLVLVPGFRALSGTIEAASGPTELDVQLSAEDWRTTEILLVDGAGHPVSGALISLNIGGRAVWARQNSDATGRCTLRSAADLPYSILVERDGYLPTQLGARPAKASPISFTVPLYPSIEGRVVDESAKPLAGIQIGMMLAERIDSKTGDGLHLLPLRGMNNLVATDEFGRFRLAPLVRLDAEQLRGKADLHIWPQRICFADKDLHRVLFWHVDVRDSSRAQEIILRPARPVRIPIEHVVAVASGAFVSQYSIQDSSGAIPQRAAVPLVSGLSRQGRTSVPSASAERIEAYLPAGNYRVQVDSVAADSMEHVESKTTEIAVPEGDGPVSLPPVQMSVAPLRSLKGKLAPEIDATDAQTSAPVKLANHRGKVVVLDFWGVWCGPCLAAMTHLIDAHDRFRGQPVEIIALHDQSIQSGGELRNRLASVKSRLWNNRDLPFTVALDTPDPRLGTGDPQTGKGATVSKYKISSFPTTIVIGKDGKVVGRVDVRNSGELRAMILKALNTSPQ